ncbi:MAG: DUF1573 domain-containing protein [Roseibacillus sp.]|nr:DUF1573 domain-containing protein [Roseibacillus sp.]
MKNPRLMHALVLGIVFVVPSACFGQFVFERSEVVMKLPPDQDRLSVEFPFTVKGKVPVTIKEYKAACSCLSAEISENGKLTWKPGEKGVVRGNFKLGTIKGKIEKKIVLNIAGEAAPLVLTTKLDIPHLFAIEPPTLFWDLDGEAKLQKFKVKVNHDEAIRITDISGTNEQFKYELKVVKPGWEYEVEVTPMHVKERAFGLLRLRNDCKFKKHASAQAFMVVRVPKVGTKGK